MLRAGRPGPLKSGHRPWPGNFHTAHPHTRSHRRLTLLTQIVIFWEKNRKGPSLKERGRKIQFFEALHLHLENPLILHDLHGNLRKRFESLHTETFLARDSDSW